MTAAFLTESTDEELEAEGIPLETHGSCRGGNPSVHHHNGFNLPVMSFDEWKSGRPDAPRREQRSPKHEDGWYVDQYNTRRILCLLDALHESPEITDPLAMRQLLEVRRRVETLNPLHV